ncbi:Cysteine protease [Phytophthora megakarya]|uniref:Cysteine protease n=1 Tax=Phytophthora megakarya TaxID=4795 RepID=A0A225VUV1_9STRA|nr:Cysteine protease [Phytophthora megakarya]
MPPKLADGTFISAFCYRIHQSYPSVFLVEIATAHPHTRRSKRNSMDVYIKRKAKKTFNSRATLFIPVNFGNIQWCGIIVDATTRKICLYDSMNCVGYKHALKELSQDFVKELEADFHIDESCTRICRLPEVHVVCAPIDLTSDHRECVFSPPIMYAVLHAVWAPLR